MKCTYFFQILILILSSCNNTSYNNTITCDCCQQTYTNIDSARNCILKKPYSKSSSDPRLFLIAFVRKDIESNQKIGWNIIKDKEIIDIARRNYLLITLDANKFQIPKDLNANELNKYINQNNSDLFFIIANQSLYPFSDWTLNDIKSTIIERLGVGDVP
jgi:hypothetical protein